MPFIKFKTDLASIKFGQDRPGGGSSDQPFMTFPNNNQQISDALVGTSVFFSDAYSTVTPTSDTPKVFLDLYSYNEKSLDFPIRGGNLDFNVYTQTVTKLGLVDKQRIEKFFRSDPRGKMFLIKQIGLQFSNPKMQTGDAIFSLTEPRSPQLVENTRIFNNGINLLTQVGLEGTGAHVKRHGLFPINPLEKNYAATVLGQGIDQNRLVLLSQLKLTKDSRQVVTASNLNARALAAKLGISYNRNILFNYPGGPGSVYGVGSTNIKRYVDTTTLSSPNAMTYDKINERVKEDVKTVSDFRYYTEQSKTGPAGRWGNLNTTLVYKFKVAGVDQLNIKNLIYFKNNRLPWKLDTPNEKSEKDIIKFVFEAIDNDHSDNSIAIFFRAFLTGLTDNHQASISSFKYFGRGEDFYTYQGVSRGINFGFKIAAFSKEEMRPLYKKLNHLISQVYPDYSQGGIMRAPLMRVTIGDYLYRVAGFLESVNVTVDENSSWEIDSIEDSTDLRQLPHVVSVNCSFKPIQDFLPKRETFKNQNVPYITEYQEQGNWLDVPVTKNNTIATIDQNRTELSDIASVRAANSQPNLQNFKFNPPNLVTINTNTLVADNTINNQFEVDQVNISQNSRTTIQAADNEINTLFKNRPRNYQLNVGDAVGGIVPGQ